MSFNFVFSLRLCAFAATFKMKIAICQVNPTVGALDVNKELILSKYREAIEGGALI